MGLVLYSASGEPFFRFRWSDAVLHFGLGPALMVALLAWEVGWIRALGARRRERGGRMAMALSALWVGLVLFYLGLSIAGYAGDLWRPKTAAGEATAPGHRAAIPSSDPRIANRSGGV